jgi:ferredoxin
VNQVRIDRRKCLAYGVCAMTAPDLFELPEDEDVAQLVRQPQTPREWQSAHEAAAGCPASAIAIEDEP